MKNVGQTTEISGQAALSLQKKTEVYRIGYRDKSIYLHSLDLSIELSDIYTNIQNLNFDKNVVVPQAY